MNLDRLFARQNWKPIQRILGYGSWAFHQKNKRIRWIQYHTLEERTGYFCAPMNITAHRFALFLKARRNNVSLWDVWKLGPGF